MSNFPFAFRSALPEGGLLFGEMTCTQAVSSLDEIELNLLSPRDDIAPEDLLGKPAAVTLQLDNGGERLLHGIVMRFGITGNQGGMNGYHASLRPWLWFLTRSTDCKIFQSLTVPDIVRQVFADYADIALFRFQLHRSYNPRNYCVQYRETDFNFVARLLEDEGIWWYFDHTEQGAELVLVDDPTACSPLVCNDTLPFYGATGSALAGIEKIDSWAFSREIATGQVALTSYDFERPSVSLAASSALERAHGLAALEQFDFDGSYTQQDDGRRWASDRIEELQSRHERLAGTTNARAMASGALFTLARHPRADQNTTYLCLHTRLTARLPSPEAGQNEAHFGCAFTAMPASQALRAARKSPKPFVQGPQTAVVVGPAGDEIFTDKYGRVKVQFHWDRYGQKNEKSSCWVRVSSPWAGKSFGFVQLPRIGQEVIVDFLEGDPDQPIITGRVYNAEQMPPWELPANATQSGWLTRSSKAGSYTNANAIRFEDKKGAEQLWLHAEKNQLTEVENDEVKWVGHDRTKTVDHDETVHVKHDRTETVGNDETITVGVNRTEAVGKNETITIGANRTEVVGINETVTIGANRTEQVGANETESIGANRSVTIGGNKTETVAMAKAETIGLAKALTIGLGYQTSVGAMMNTTVGGFQAEQIGLHKNIKVLGGDFDTTVSKSYVLSTGKNIELTATDEIKLSVGKSMLVMKKDGTITLNGKDISLLASGDFYGEAKGDIQLKGKNIKNNS